jgi:putative ABC transport system substrate-binding protein
MHFHQWKRREFITLLGGAAAWPLAAGAQQPAMPVIGFIRNTTRDDSADLLKAMHQGLRQTGYVEGRNVAVEYRFADNQLDRLPTMAADLVRRQAAVIVTGGDASSFAAKTATTTIPIIFSTGFDPIEIGLVTSLSRPAGNVTGVSFFSTLGTAAKRLGLVDLLMPKDAIIAYLRNPNSPAGEPELGEVKNVGSERELEPSPRRAARQRPFFVHRPSQTPCRPDGAPSAPHHALFARIHRNWRPDELRRERYRCLSPGRSIRW